MRSRGCSDQNVTAFVLFAHSFESADKSQASPGDLEDEEGVSDRSANRTVPQIETCSVL